MNGERQRAQHLRLVPFVNEDDPVRDKLTSQKARQLAFPYPEVSAIFFVRVDLISREEFAHILGQLAPRWIVDVRVVPRLDTVARSRLSAFHLFAKAKADYVDLFGRLEIRSYKSANANPIFWSNAVLDILKASERKGPYLFLFDNELLSIAANQILASTLEPLVGPFPQIVHLKHSAKF